MSLTGRKTPIESRDSLNVIVNGTLVEGTIQSNSNFRIDGHVKGTIKVKGKLVLGNTGKVEGDLECENAEIEGEFIGNIVVKQFLQLKSNAKVVGDVYVDKFSIEPGGIFNGKCIMNNSSKSDINKVEK